MYLQSSNFETTHQLIESDQAVLPQYSLFVGSFLHVFWYFKTIFTAFLCHHIIFHEGFGPNSMLCVTLCLEDLTITVYHKWADFRNQ